MPIFTFTLSAQQLETYLGDLFQGFQTKDYELVIALILARLAYFKTGEIHEIGFEVKADAGKNFPLKPTQTEINDIILYWREENTNYDLFVIPESHLGAESNRSRNVGRAVGNAFQIKKFDEVKDGEFSEPLINYLQTFIPKKYGSSTATLVLVIGTINSGEINFEKIHNSFVSDKYPFTNVFVISGNEEKFTIGEIFPSLNIENYSFTDFFSS